MTTVLIPVLKGTLPGFPTAPQPDVLHTLIIILLIPAGIALLVTLLTIGPRWFGHAPAQPPVPADPRGEVLPSDAELEARRALVHHAAEHNEPRGDRPILGGKTDEESYLY